MKLNIPIKCLRLCVPKIQKLQDLSTGPPDPPREAGSLPEGLQGIRGTGVSGLWLLGSWAQGL